MLSAGNDLLYRIMGWITFWYFCGFHVKLVGILYLVRWASKMRKIQKIDQHRNKQFTRFDGLSKFTYLVLSILWRDSCIEWSDKISKRLLASAVMPEKLGFEPNL